ncbi:MAG: hypothetical protein ABEJ24_02095 [Candidatus Magasanikbacteria bacterium]
MSSTLRLGTTVVLTFLLALSLAVAPTFAKGNSERSSSAVEKKQEKAHKIKKAKGDNGQKVRGLPGALKKLDDKFDKDDHGKQALAIPIYLGDGWVCKYDLLTGTIVSCFHYEKLEGDTQ